MVLKSVKEISRAANEAFSFLYNDPANCEDSSGFLFFFNHQLPRVCCSKELSIPSNVQEQVSNQRVWEKIPPLISARASQEVAPALDS